MAARSRRSCTVSIARRRRQGTRQHGKLVCACNGITNTHLVRVIASRIAQLKIRDRDVKCTGGVADVHNTNRSFAAAGAHEQHVQLPDAPALTHTTDQTTV
jgi:hypothetical protein